MIEPCPKCGSKPEPVKASYEAWTINCCGLSVVDEWFVGAIMAWQKVVAMYEKVKHEDKI